MRKTRKGGWKGGTSQNGVDLACFFFKGIGSKTTSFWLVPLKLRRVKTTPFWTHQIKKNRAQSSPLQPDGRRSAYLVRGESGDRVAPCAPKRCLRERASLAFRRGVGGWHRAALSLGAPFTTMDVRVCPYGLGVQSKGS